MHFITIGFDCSPASALRALGRRPFALPFDWVVSNQRALLTCMSEDFRRFHTDLHLSADQTCVIDAYGFEFPHDYPRSKAGNISDNGEYYAEVRGSIVNQHWQQHSTAAKAKYARRIARFLAMVRDPVTPVIVLSRYPGEHMPILQDLLQQIYPTANFYFVNSTTNAEAIAQKHPRIRQCNTEATGAWNDPQIWKQCVDELVHVIEAGGEPKPPSAGFTLRKLP
jgi:hypothetical protein